MNIFVPYKSFVESVKLSIFFWIHSGGDDSGSVSEDYYDASTLVSMSNIIVTIIYRLGAFGFLNTLNTDAKGNQGH